MVCVAHHKPTHRYVSSSVFFITHALVAEKVQEFKPDSGWACTLIFSPVDPEFLFLIGEKEVKLVHVPTNKALKTFPTKGIDTRCETDAVAVNAAGTELFVATNFSKRLLCFATQGCKLKWDISTANENLSDDEQPKQHVESLLLADVGDGCQTLFYAGLMNELSILFLAHVTQVI